jgi:hypothetical protein
MVYVERERERERERGSYGRAIDTIWTREFELNGHGDRVTAEV